MINIKNPFRKKIVEKMAVTESTPTGQIEVFPLAFNIGERLPVNGDQLYVKSADGAVQVRVGAIIGMNWGRPEKGGVIPLNRSANRHPQKLIVTVAGTKTLVIPKEVAGGGIDDDQE